MFNSERKRKIEAAKLVLSYAVEFGKPRFAISAANFAGLSLTLPQKTQISQAIKSRPAAAERVEDYIDFIGLIAVTTAAYQPFVDEMVEEIAGWNDGEYIPRIAQYAKNSRVRVDLIKNMFTRPAGSVPIMAFFEALGPPGLSSGELSYWGEELMKLAIRLDDESALSAAAFRFAKRGVAPEEWKVLIRKRMQIVCDEKSFETVLHTAFLAMP